MKLNAAGVNEPFKYGIIGFSLTVRARLKYHMKTFASVMKLLCYYPMS